MARWKRAFAEKRRLDGSGRLNWIERLDGKGRLEGRRRLDGRG